MIAVIATSRVIESENMIFLSVFGAVVICLV